MQVASFYLTRIEEQALLLKADGHSTKQIARKTGRSVSAVEKCLRRACSRLGCPNTAALIARLKDEELQATESALIELQNEAKAAHAALGRLLSRMCVVVNQNA